MIASAADAASLRVTPLRTKRWHRVEMLVALAGVAGLAMLAIATLTPQGRERLDVLPSWSLPVLAAAAVYAVGHLLRGLRLVVLLHDSRVGARRILSVHLFTAGLALLLPFRLGDLPRIRATGVLVGNMSRGLVAVVLERLLDVAVVLSLGLVATVTAGGSMTAFAPVLIFSTIFVVSAVAALTLLPAYLRALSLYIVRRPQAPGGERLLEVLDRMLHIVDQAPHLLRRRTSTLVLLTTLIWMAELSALGIAVPALGGDPVQLARGLLSFLSSLSSGSVALASQPGQSPPYRTVLLVPLLWASAVSGMLLARQMLPRLIRPGRSSW